MRFTIGRCRGGKKKKKNLNTALTQNHRRVGSLTMNLHFYLLFPRVEKKEEDSSS